MSQKIKVGQLNVNVFFSKYDKLTKKRTEIEGHELTHRDIKAIHEGLDSTDFGEFYKYENGDIEITGMFNVVDSYDNELD